jgi:hypothetical protein
MVGAAFGTFMFVTAVYLLASYVRPTPPPPLVYFGVVLLCEAIAGMLSVRSACASLDPATLGIGLLQTLLPWVVVFGVVLAALSSQALGAAWRAPFANGIVYPILAMATNVKALLKDVVPGSFQGDDYTAATQLNVADFQAKMTEWGSTNEAAQAALLKIIAQRDLWADAVWFVLAGFLSSSIAGSSLASIKCSPTAAQMRQAYQVAVKQVDAEDHAKKDARVYSVTN